MDEEHRTPDPTRKLLRTFGVKVTSYEERTAEILERIQAGDLAADERLRLASEALALSQEIGEIMREMSDHVLDAQARVLAGLEQALRPST